MHSFAETYQSDSNPSKAKVMPSHYDVFVSYSSRDTAIVSRVVKDLSQAGLTVWWDQSSIRPAERIREAINRGIQNSATVLIFISSKSLESRWVLNELDAAMLKEISERKPLVFPVLIGRIATDSLPEDLKGKNILT
jgi:TIR domain